MSDIGDTIEAAVKDAMSGIAIDAEHHAEFMAGYARERARVLARAIDQPGFTEALEAERQNVASYALLNAVQASEDAKQRAKDVLLTIITTVARTAPAAL